MICHITKILFFIKLFVLLINHVLTELSMTVSSYSKETRLTSYVLRVRITSYVSRMNLPCLQTITYIRFL